MNQNCSVEYIVTDGNGLQSTGTISWTVEPTSVIANPDGPITVTQGEDAEFNVTANDTNPEGTGGITLTQVDGQSITGGSVTTADGIVVIDQGNGDLIIETEGVVPGTYSITYTIVDADGDTSQSTFTVVINETSMGNFVIDNGDGSNVSGTDVKDALANDVPFAVTDGAQAIMQTFQGATAAADLQNYVEGLDGDIVFDPATCEWEDPNGAAPTVPICVAAEACGIQDTIVDRTLRETTVSGSITTGDTVTLESFNPGGNGFDLAQSGTLIHNTMTMEITRDDSQNGGGWSGNGSGFISTGGSSESVDTTHVFTPVVEPASTSRGCGTAPAVRVVRIQDFDTIGGTVTFAAAPNISDSLGFTQTGNTFTFDGPANSNGFIAFQVSDSPVTVDISTPASSGDGLGMVFSTSLFLPVQAYELCDDSTNFINPERSNGSAPFGTVSFQQTLQQSDESSLQGIP